MTNLHTTTNNDTKCQVSAKLGNAPKITPKHIDDCVKSVAYLIIPDTLVTVCTLTLTDGAILLGEAHCVSPDNFNEQLGRDTAYKKAKEKIWELEGYLLRQRLYEALPVKSTEPPTLSVDATARVCHEVNRAYCQSLGDYSQLPWELAPQWQKDSAMLGVNLHLSGDHGPEASHKSWMKQKLSDGWVYGPVKDANLKQHPCLVKFDSLPLDQQAKDYIFRSVVHALHKPNIF